MSLLQSFAVAFALVVSLSQSLFSLTVINQTGQTVTIAPCYLGEHKATASLKALKPGKAADLAVDFATHDDHVFLNVASVDGAITKKICVINGYPAQRHLRIKYRLVDFVTLDGDHAIAADGGHETATLLVLKSELCQAVVITTAHIAPSDRAVDDSAKSETWWSTLFGGCAPEYFMSEPEYRAALMPYTPQTPAKRSTAGSLVSGDSEEEDITSDIDSTASTVDFSPTAAATPYGGAGDE